jgi:hypothetical protein
VAGANLENLLRGIEAIYADLGEPGPGDDEILPFETDDFEQPLEPAVEAQIAAVLNTLRRIGGAARNASNVPAPPPGVPRAALGGAALLMRSDFLVGRGGQIPDRLAAFAYLTTLIFLGQEEAERRSREVQALVEAEGFAAG